MDTEVTELEQVFCHRLMAPKYDQRAIEWDIKRLAGNPANLTIRLVVEALATRARGYNHLDTIEMLAYDTLVHNKDLPLVQTVLLHEATLSHAGGKAWSIAQAIIGIGTKHDELLGRIIHAQDMPTWDDIVTSTGLEKWHNIPEVHNQTLLASIRRVMVPADSCDTARYAKHLASLSKIGEMAMLRKTIVDTIVSCPEPRSLMAVIAEHFATFWREVTATLTSAAIPEEESRRDYMQIFENLCQLTRMYCGCMHTLAPDNQTECSQLIFGSEQRLWLWKEWECIFSSLPLTNSELVANYIKQWQLKSYRAIDRIHAAVCDGSYLGIVRSIGRVNYAEVLAHCPQPCVVQLATEYAQREFSNQLVEFGFLDAIRDQPDTYVPALRTVIESGRASVQCLCAVCEQAPDDMPDMLHAWLDHIPYTSNLLYVDNSTINRFVTLLSRANVSALHTRLNEWTYTSALVLGGYQLRHDDITCPRDIFTLLHVKDDFRYSHHQPMEFYPSAWWKDGHNAHELLQCGQTMDLVLKSALLSASEFGGDWLDWLERTVVPELETKRYLRVVLNHIAWDSTEKIAISIRARALFAKNNRAQIWTSDADRVNMQRYVQGHAREMILYEPHTFLGILDENSARSLLLDNVCGLLPSDVSVDPSLWKHLFINDPKSTRRLIGCLTTHAHEIRDAQYIQFVCAMGVTNNPAVIRHIRPMMDKNPIPEGVMEILEAAP